MTVVMSVHDPTHSDSVNPYQILGGKGKVIKLQLVFRCMVTTTVDGFVLMDLGNNSAVGV